MNELEYVKKHGKDDFYKNLLICWDNIELYNEMRLRERRDFWKWLLKTKLGIECSENVYNN